LHDEIERFRGQLVRRATSGFVATFDGPARAIRCAATILEHGKSLGLDIRAGLHCGEYARSGDDLHGVATQIATRVMSRANAGEVLVSSTITDLVAGSGIRFEPSRQRLVTGADRELELYRVAAGVPAHPEPELSSRERSTEASRLSPREREVATLIGRGYSNRQVADDLGISIATVERHAANIFTKLGVHSRSQVAVWIASQEGFRSNAS
jgi:DNA-binding CsgD family transcriptional regulator